jgi:Small-conductance mechanosensitive channel
MDIPMGFMSGAPAWIRAAVILVAGWLAVRLAGAALSRAMARADLDPTLTAFARRALSAALWLMLLAVVLGTLGFDVAGFIAGLSVTGFVLGFAAKDALGNLAAGVLLMVYRPFGVGDTVSAGGVDGVVREITVTHDRDSHRGRGGHGAELQDLGRPHQEQDPPGELLRVLSECYG